MKTPLISVIIVHHNNINFLKDLLPNLTAQYYKNYEIIIVDNASTDGSVKFIEGKYPDVKIVRNKSNVGFAEGNNIGYKKSSGEYIVLLNNDTKITRNYLSSFIKVFEINDKVGIAQSKIILTKNRGLDTCGSFWTNTSFLYYFGNYKNPKDRIYNKPFRIFAAKGASMIIKRDLIKKIGLFDSDYWSYYEETDLCHRAWIAGWETWYWPKALCYHKMGGTSLTFSNEFVQFHNYKNKLSSYVKNLEITHLIPTFILFFILNVLISVAWLFQGKFNSALSLYKALVWNIINLNKTLEKREKNNKHRVKRDQSIWSLVKKEPSPIYYLYLFNDNLGKYKDEI